MIRSSLLASAAIVVLGLAATPALAQIQGYKVAPSDLSSYWIRTNTHVYADSPNSGQGLSAVGCASVSYVIGADGNTRDVKVEKVVPSTSDFQLIAKSMIQAFHYRAADSNPHDRPVATYFIVPFNIPTGDKATLERVLKSCHLPGYGD
ncbi:MAG TPA: energy transducer TonB [Oleiagrimonas sp.]|nr:energy transducer TonB [Oleiagrimonas sp.]